MKLQLFIRGLLKDKDKKQEKFVENIALQYQLSLKYAKDVYLSLCKIEQILRDKKDNYFSNAAYSLSSFTNQQRNQFDQQTKEALKMCSNQIDQLKVTSERLNENHQKSKLGNKRTSQTYCEHLKQVILCLHYFFKRLQSQFGQFLKYNQFKKKKILRQRLHQQSTLSIQPQKIHKQPQYFQRRKQNNQMQQADPENTNAQLQREAHLFYLQKIDDQKKAVQTNQTIQSISSILEQMSKKVLDQQLLTSSFQEIGSVGLSFIQQGNKNLLEANTLSKQGGKYWMLLFLGLALSLLVVDFLKS